MKETKGCLIFLGICLFVIAVALGFNYVLAKVIIWLADQLFNVDWSDKTLAVFIAVTILTSISIKISKDK